ncbi:hypothetical protein AKJ16_DCAP03575 [Drosera capensis]
MGCHSIMLLLCHVRRDLKLFLSIHIEDPLESGFNVITERKTAQKLALLESLKKRNREAGKYSFMERLLGAARLLSQMVEPMMKSAMYPLYLVVYWLYLMFEIATLLARSFFMGFSLAILALIARLRVLVQQEDSEGTFSETICCISVIQILVDVVTVYNEVSSISQKKQSLKITQDGVEVFRDYYPSMDEIVTLECAWETDKFVLVEKNTKCSFSDEHQDFGGPSGTAPVRYNRVKAFLGVEELDSSETDTDHSVEEDLTQRKKRKIDPFATLLNPSGTVAPSGKSCEVECCNSSPYFKSSSLLKAESATKSKVAFISVKKPEPSTSSPEEGEFIVDPGDVHPPHHLDS